MNLHKQNSAFEKFSLGGVCSDGSSTMVCLYIGVSVTGHVSFELPFCVLVCFVLFFVLFGAISCLAALDTGIFYQNLIFTVENTGSSELLLSCFEYRHY